MKGHIFLRDCHSDNPFSDWVQNTQGIIGSPMETKPNRDSGPQTKGGGRWPSQFCLRNQLAIDHMGSNTYGVNQQLKLSSSPSPLPSPFQMLANESSPPE